MIPLRDDAPRIGTPYVTYALIVINTAVFLFEFWLGLGGHQNFEGFVYQFGIVPARFSVVLFNHGYVPWNLISQLGARYIPTTEAILPLLTSMFLHAGWLHLIFNMWALWIFGDNVENYLGPMRYLVFYLLCGLGGGLLHTAFNINSTQPSVGASGAIAGVMGAFFLLFPRARVLTLVPFFWFFFLWLPAWIVLGYWFVAQFLSGAASSIASRGGNTAGIAFWAHVGGFLVGMLLIKVFPARVRRYHYGY